MSSKLDYLKKYMGDDTNKKKKKKKAPAQSTTTSGFIIKDADADAEFARIPSDDEDNAPVVVDAPLQENIRPVSSRPLVEPTGRWEEVAKPAAGPSDMSPPRRGGGGGGERYKETDLSPPRKRQHTSDTQVADMSPPRRGGGGGEARHKETDLSPPRKRQHTSDTQVADMSPPRRGGGGGERHRETDLSPPRKRHHTSDTQVTSHQADMSPPRRGGGGGERHRETDLSPPRKRQHTSDTQVTSHQAAPAGTGLISSAQFKESMKQQQTAPTEASRPDETVYRDKKGRKLDMLNELMAHRAGKKVEEQPMEWGKGVAQKKEAEDKKKEFEKIKNAPFARYELDEDVDKEFKENVRFGDPMARQLAKKKARESGQPERPVCRFAAAPNRFNIAPGYKWDGVDRSNGFERKFFERQALRRTQDQSAAMWSVADM